MSWGFFGLFFLPIIYIFQQITRHYYNYIWDNPVKVHVKHTKNDVFPVCFLLHRDKRRWCWIVYIYIWLFSGIKQVSHTPTHRYWLVMSGLKMPLQPFSDINTIVCYQVLVPQSNCWINLFRHYTWIHSHVTVNQSASIIVKISLKLRCFPLFLWFLSLLGSQCLPRGCVDSPLPSWHTWCHTPGIQVLLFIL